MTLPKVALIGRPNVGKSTLFNCLTNSRKALVSAISGMTRDLRYGIGELYLDNQEEPQHIGDCEFIDTGGITAIDGEVFTGVSDLSWQAAAEADVVLVVLDGAASSFTSEDQEMITNLRRNNIDYWVVANKIAGKNQLETASWVAELGVATDVFYTDAQTKRGVKKLGRALALHFYNLRQLERRETDEHDNDTSLKISIVGRPNAGKSSLFNALIGSERALVSSESGTTRDDVQVSYKLGDVHWQISDTAGLFKGWRKKNQADYLSTSRMFDSVDYAGLTLLVMDINELPGKPEQILVDRALARGSACYLVINKVDTARGGMRRAMRSRLEQVLRFAKQLPCFEISAERGNGLEDLKKAVTKAQDVITADYSASKLCASLHRATADHPPPFHNSRRILPKFASPIRINPLVVLVQGNNCESLPRSYQQYLSRHFANDLQIKGGNVKIYTRNQSNPYSD